jgi:hypothetical protein
MVMVVVVMSLGDAWSLGDGHAHTAESVIKQAACLLACLLACFFCFYKQAACLLDGG